MYTYFWDASYVNWKKIIQICCDEIMCIWSLIGYINNYILYMKFKKINNIGEIYILDIILCYDNIVFIYGPSAI